MKNPGELCKCGQMPLHCAHVTAPPQSDPPIAPGQEEWEHWFAGEIGLAEDCPEQIKRLLILRAYYHAEACDAEAGKYEPLLSPTIGWKNNANAWRRRAEELSRGK